MICQECASSTLRWWEATVVSALTVSATGEPSTVSVKMVTRGLFLGSAALSWKDRKENMIIWDILIVFLGLLITGGEGTEHTTEIFVPSTNTSCNFVRMPNARDDHSQDGFQVCGGQLHLRTCDTWNPETGLWTKSQSLRYSRQNHNSWVSEERAILLGGSDSQTTTEMLTNGTGSSKEHFSLKYSTRF